MIRNALELLERYSIVPIESRGKKPLISWEEFQNRKASPEEVKNWFTKWPNANIGIVTGRISGIVVVDMDNNNAIEWVKSNMPPTNLYVRTGKGYHAYYAYPVTNTKIGNRTRLADGVDIRADGGYVLAPPSVHPSGAVYKWMTKEGSMPEYPLTKISTGIDLSTIKNTPVTLEPAAQGERNDTATRIAGRYFAKGMDFEEVLNLLRGWNLQNMPPLNEKELITIISSVQRAHIKNYKDTLLNQGSSIHTNISLVSASDMKPPSALSLPPSSGLLLELINYFDESTVVSQPEYNLAAAIATLGAIVGAKVCTETDLRTNFYTMAIGSSSSGKSAPIASIRRLLSESPELIKLMGANKIASGSAILQSIANRPVQLMVLDESPDLLNGIKNPLSPKANIPEMLKELYTNTGQYIKDYAQKENNIAVKYHNLCIYGTGTPNAFWGNFTHSSVTDGFLARLLIFTNNNKIPKRKKTTLSLKPNDELISDLVQLASFNAPVSGDLGAPKPILVPFDTQAKRVFDEWSDSITDLQNDHINSELGIDAVYGKSPENAAKLALLAAMSDMTGLQIPLKKINATISLQNVEWAIAVVDYLLANIVEMIQANISESVIDALTSKVVKFMKNTSKTYIRRSDLLNNIRQLDATNFDNVINTLIQRGTITEDKIPTVSGQYKKIYYMATQSADEESDISTGVLTPLTITTAKTVEGSK